jgi:hypothetical protein
VTRGELWVSENNRDAPAAPVGSPKAFERLYSVRAVHFSTLASKAFRRQGQRQERHAMTEKPIMPFFVFARRRDIEREMGLVLAGRLFVDISNRKKPKRWQQRSIANIVQGLTKEARSGQMPDGAVVYGWAGGCKPTNAVDVHDDAVMAAWAKSTSSSSSGSIRATMVSFDSTVTYCWKWVC